MEGALKNESAKKTLRQLTAALKKYAPVIGVGLVGLLLLLWPSTDRSEKEEPAAQAQTDETLAQTERRLEEVLSSIDGAGEVKVMLTLCTGAENVYQTDEKRSADDTGQSQETATVFYQQGSAQKLPVVVKTEYPVYRGALVVCSGADKATVQLAIVDAVRSLTGLRSDKITVVKMKCQ